MPSPTSPTPATPTPQPSTPTASAAMAVPSAVTQPVDNRDVMAAVRSATAVGGSVDNRMDLLNPNIVAKPLSSASDPFFALRPKNPDVVFRGITYCVMVKGEPNYQRYEQAKAQGYVNVVPADVQGAVPAMLIRDGGTKIMTGDCILMKIDKALYRGALKWKDQQALRSTQAAGQKDQGAAEIKRAAQETNMPGKLSRKLSPYAPTASEITKDFGDDE